MAEDGGGGREVTGVRVGCSSGGGALVRDVGEELVKLGQGVGAWRATEK